MSKNRKRILLVSVNWLGDLLFLTPAIRAVRRAYPDSFIAVLSPRRGMDFLQGNPHLNAVIPMPEGRGIPHLAGWLPLIARLRAERFDAAFLFHRSFTRAAAVWVAGIPERIGYRTAKRGWLLTTAVEMPPPDTLHKVDLLLRVVEAAGIRADGRHYDAGLRPEDAQAAGDLARELGLNPSDRVVALHAGANWLLKRWPARRFAELADRLSERYGAKVLFIGGEGDRPLIERIAGEMKSRPLVSAGRTTFRQMGALLKHAKLLISNDSGPLHMGMAAGVPVVALFGPTDPKLTGPVNGAKAAVLFGSIGCPVPCYQLRCPANLCMEQISVEQVLAAAARFLDD
ncbi:MAG: lipopolysaccharide heptosyltransferase II [Candidatus Omnitrophota bacterium]|nr:lipopolysaccharide heptosyltransferase II [Candidatus Omnitrophota bacterium]